MKSGFLCLLALFVAVCTTSFGGEFQASAEANEVITLKIIARDAQNIMVNINEKWMDMDRINDSKTLPAFSTELLAAEAAQPVFVCIDEDNQKRSYFRVYFSKDAQSKLQVSLIAYDIHKHEEALTGLQPETLKELEKNPKAKKLVEDLLRGINAERADRGLDRLQISEQLCERAEKALGVYPPIGSGYAPGAWMPYGNSAQAVFNHFKNYVSVVQHDSALGIAVRDGIILVTGNRAGSRPHYSPTLNRR